MSSQGVTFVMRGLLVLSMIVVGAIVRTFVGPSRRRGYAVLAGTVGGLAFSMLVSDALPVRLHMRESAVLAVFGMYIGWGAAWLFTRHVRREAD